MSSVNKVQPDLLFIPPLINPVLRDQEHNYIPTGLLVLSGSLSASGYKGTIYHPRIVLMEQQDLHKIALDILSYNSRTIGFSTWCHSFPQSILIAAEIKKLQREVPIIFGGPQATALARKILEKYACVDYVLKGEADYTLTGLLDVILKNGSSKKLSGIAGLVYRSSDRSEKKVSDNDTGYVKDLDKLPLPRYEKILHKNYLTIDTGRGCPFKCTYCSTNQFFSRSYRTKSVERIIQEIDYCFSRMGATWFEFAHDMITLDKKFISELGCAIRRYYKLKNKKFGWTCSARTDCVSEELLENMAENGCKGIFFGIETGSQSCQKKIKKNLKLDDAENKVRKAVCAGMNTAVSYMAGFPYETREDLNKTLFSVLTMTMAGAMPQMSLLALLPGTPLYDDYVGGLKYDGENTGFVDVVTSRPVEKIIREDPEMFSSFFYLDNPFINRATYLYITNLVNHLHNFIPTILSLGDYIKKDINRLDILDYIDSNIHLYTEKESVKLPELTFLIESIKKYLVYLEENRDMPDYTWGIFQADVEKAATLVKYKKWQVSRHHSPALTDSADEYKGTSQIRVIPTWKLFKSYFNIYHRITDPISHKDKKPGKGLFYYVIQPESDFAAKIFKFPVKHWHTLENMTDTTVNEFVRENQPGMSETESRKLLKRMVKLNMAEVLK